MTRFLTLTALVLSTACAQVGITPSTDSLIGSLRKGYSSPSGLVNGISEATLYPGYWSGMPEAVVHDPGVNSVPATDLDPLITRLTWMTDTVTYAAEWAAMVTALRTEWGTDAQKFSGTIDRTFYVDPDAGSNGDDGLTEGNAWATLLYAVNTVGTGDGTATKIVLMPGVHYLEANSADNGTGDPAGGSPTVKIQNYAGTASDPLIIQWQSGASVRLGHTWAAAYFEDVRDGTYDLNVGIQVSGTSSYVEFWDAVMVGPMFEIPYSDGGGAATAITVLSHTGTTIKVIGGEFTQWPHCGLKGSDLMIYGAYVHNNGAGSGNYYGATSGAALSGHDHNIYLTGDGTESIIEGCVIIDGFTTGINPRDYSDSNLVVRGNIIGWNGACGANIGGFGTRVEHNTFVNNTYTAILWGSDSAGLLLRNNAIYGDDIDILGLGAAYTRPIGFVWSNNAALTGESPSSVPTYTAWTTATTVPRPASLYYGANNYYNQVSASAATGATPPTHTSGSVSDGTITWRYVGDAGIETFNTFTTIDSADFEDFANFDFRPATGSDLLGNGTDIGYGTTIGPFNAAP